MSRVKLTLDSLYDFLAEHRGRITEWRYVKGRRCAQIVIPARGNRPQQVKTIEVDES